jgi:hypothetical protein
MLKFTREKEDKYGKTNIIIKEIPIDGSSSVIDVDGKLITLKPLQVSISGRNIKCYVFIEKFPNYDITNVDLLYGNIDLENMQSDASYREKILNLLDRNSIENITRNRFGALFPESPYGKDDDLVKANVLALSDAIKSGDAYKIGYVKKNKIYDTFSRKKTSKRTSLLESFKEVFIGSSSQQESDENFYIQETGRFLLMYQSGMVILGGIECPKFSYIEQDVASGEITSNTFFTSGLKMDRFKKDEEYKMKFLKMLAKERILTVLRTLRKNRNVDFTYLGDYSGGNVFSLNQTVSKIVNEINESNPEYLKR